MSDVPPGDKPNYDPVGDAQAAYDHALDNLKQSLVATAQTLQYVINLPSDLETQQGALPVTGEDISISRTLSEAAQRLENVRCDVLDHLRSVTLVAVATEEEIPAGDKARAEDYLQKVQAISPAVVLLGEITQILTHRIVARGALQELCTEHDVDQNDDVLLQAHRDQRMWQAKQMVAQSQQVLPTAIRMLEARIMEAEQQFSLFADFFLELELREENGDEEV